MKLLQEYRGHKVYLAKDGTFVVRPGIPTRAKMSEGGYLSKKSALVAIGCHLAHVRKAKAEWQASQDADKSDTCICGSDMAQPKCLECRTPLVLYRSGSTPARAQGYLETWQCPNGCDPLRPGHNDVPREPEAKP